MRAAGFGALAAIVPTGQAAAAASRPAPAAPVAATGTYLFHHEFDGPAGSAPDPSKWVVANHRTPIKNPTGFDRPEFFGQYRDNRQNVFLDGKSNLVLRATKDGDDYFGGLVSGTWRGAIGTTWEARIKLSCLDPGCWPAWWLSNDDAGRSGEVDLLEWYGNGEWPSGTTVHANPDGTAFETHPIGVDGAWHTWRVTRNPGGMYFWEDYVDGAEPYFSVGQPESRISTTRSACGRSTTSATRCSRLEPRGGRCGRRRPRARNLSGRDARRLGAGLLVPPIRVRTTPVRGFITPFAKVASG